MFKNVRIFGVIFGAIGFLGALPPAGAATISLLPVQWNMIQSSGTSDGSGYHSFVGGGKEALIEFDLSSIPSGSTITSAVLTMYMDRTTATSSQPIFMYRLNSSWGMGNSGAGQMDNGIANGGGTGYTATNNDATWADRFYNLATPSSSTAWTTAGGDYATTASAYAMVGTGTATTGTQGSGGPLLSTWSSSGLASDVQNWLTGAEANDGWILNDYASATDYPPSGSAFGSITQARRFIMPANSLNGSAGTSDDRPYLTLTYTPVPEPASMTLMMFTGLLLRGRRRRD